MGRLAQQKAVALESSREPAKETATALEVQVLKNDCPSLNRMTLTLQTTYHVSVGSVQELSQEENKDYHNGI